MLSVFLFRSVFFVACLLCLGLLFVESMIAHDGDHLAMRKNGIERQM